jgi:acetyl esterase
LQVSHTSHAPRILRSDLPERAGSRIGLILAPCNDGAREDDCGAVSQSSGVRVEDVVYASRLSSSLSLRIYRPSGLGPFPALLEVHSGAWAFQDRLHSAVLAQELASRGILVASIDYRMPPAHRYPEQLVDINRATRWLKRHAGELGIHRERLGGLGLSTGGHQLVLSAMRPRHAAYVEPDVGDFDDIDASLAFAVLFYPIVDPLARYRMVRDAGRTSLIEGHEAYWPDEAAMAEGNPQLILDRGETVDLPPLLVVQGRGDANVTPDMARRFVASYRAAGGSVLLQEYEAVPHGFVLDTTNPAYPHAVALTEAFVRSQHEAIDSPAA